MVGGNHTMVGVGVPVGGGVGVTVGVAGVGSNPGSPAQPVSSKVISANKQILSPRSRGGRRDFFIRLRDPPALAGGARVRASAVNIFIKPWRKFVFIRVIRG